MRKIWKTNVSGEWIDYPIETKTEAEQTTKHHKGDREKRETERERERERAQQVKL